MPIDLRDKQPFFTPHLTFKYLYDGDFRNECLDKESLIKFVNIFDRLKEEKKESVYKDQSDSRKCIYYFDLPSEIAIYSFLELAVFFTHFYTSARIIDDSKSIMIINEFKAPLQRKIMDDSKSYYIVGKNLTIEIPLSEIKRINGYPQHFIVELENTVVLFSIPGIIVKNKSKISQFKKKYKSYASKNGSGYDIEDGNNYIPYYYKPSWYKTLSFCGLNGFKDLFLIDFRYYSNLKFRHHSIIPSIDK